MSEKSELLVNELVSACIAFGREREPEDVETRIEKAQRELREYIDELEALVDELVNIGDNLFDSLNPIAWKHEWLDKWWKLSSCRRGEREE